MIGHRVQEAARTAAVALSFLFIFAIVVLAQDRQAQGSLAQGSLAQDRRQNEPGRFDFYVLALSWSPSFCEAAQERAQERAPDRAADQQCSGRPFSFVVHGLRPQ
jgi:ribonuclease T2